MKDDFVARRSTLDSEFLSIIKSWIDLSGEAFVFMRFANTGGGKDYQFVYSFEQFQVLLQELTPRTDTIVFRLRQLPIRGEANEALLLQAIQQIPDGSDWMLASFDESGQRNSFAAYGNSHHELESAFESARGRNIWLGLDPSWWEDDNQDMQSALVPLPDGSVEGGAY